MDIQRLKSIGRINTIYDTGERPVLVECDNLKGYVAKYMKSSSSAYKLACELCGSLLAIRWKLNTPDIAFIEIRPSDWPHYGSINFSAPAFGSLKLSNVMDITPISLKSIVRSEKVFFQLLKVALFDIWIANEDRNNNNYNLLFDLLKQEIIVLDHGCVFNTATFDYGLSILTCNETILDSELASYLYYQVSERHIGYIKNYFSESIRSCAEIVLNIERYIPNEWNVPHLIVKEKLSQLFNDDWISDCWDAFLEYIECIGKYSN